MLSDIVKKYRSIILALVAFFVIIMAVEKFHNFYKSKISNLDVETSALKKKIDLGQEVSNKQKQLSKIKQVFISTDSYQFIELISAYAQDLDLDITSIKPSSSAATMSQRSEGKSVVKRMVLDVNIEGSFADLERFFKRIDEEKLNITVFQLNIKSVRDKPDEVEARVKLLGLAIEEQ